MTLRRFPDEGSWVEAALDELRAAAATVRGEGRGTLHVCLAGGATPEIVYRAAAATDILGGSGIGDGAKDIRAELWLGDERALPQGDPARNGTMVARAFSACRWKPKPTIRDWPTCAGVPRTGGKLADFNRSAEFDAARDACAHYAAELESVLGPRPRFDLAFLGLGGDGHTASLFPGERILAETRGLATPAWAPAEPRLRLSLTYPALSGTGRLRFLVRGRDKLSVVLRLAAEDPSLPASRIGARDSAILYCEA